MPESNGKDKRSDSRNFAQVDAELTALRERLPQTAVHSLAKEVVSRLADRRSDPTAGAEDNERIIDLAQRLASDQEDAGLRLIMQLQDEGTSTEDIYLVYLTGAARLLGQWWNDDTLSFADVTIGSSRIYGIMRGLRNQFNAAQTDTRKTAVFALVPGEEHTLGITMATDLFTQNGWNIETYVGLDHDEVMRIVRESDCRIFGLSASTRKALLPLGRLCVAIRSDRPEARIVISGTLTQVAPELKTLSNADAVVNSVDKALEILDSLALD